MMEGWIKFYRRFLEWEWYLDINTKCLFLHLLLKANYQPRKWQGKNIETGQLITSLGHLAKETALSVQQVRTALSKLKSTGEITCESTSHYSVITIVNWNEHQTDQQANQQSKNKPVTTTKEVKNIKKIISELNFSEEFLKPVQDWLDYKKARKESYKTDQSLTVFIKKLVNLSENCPVNALEIIEQSMASNWAGIFPLKETKGANNAESILPG